MEITRLAVTTFALTFGVILPSKGGCKVLIGKEGGDLIFTSKIGFTGVADVLCTFCGA